MLSRLSGLANTVLHELSGDGEDGGTEASPAVSSLSSPCFAMCPEDVRNMFPCSALLSSPSLIALRAPGSHVPH